MLVEGHGALADAGRLGQQLPEELVGQEVGTAAVLDAARVIHLVGAQDLQCLRDRRTALAGVGVLGRDQPARGQAEDQLQVGLLGRGQLLMQPGQLLTDGQRLGLRLGMVLDRGHDWAPIVR
ncbi:hypothetical protein DN069_32295 [Streptacidiphilus pinicola]|uniref:Uncharacterized protein n=1 Tax=Streptacidiphilus pinicola TaxID=2219663 RepID=A0A2X0IAJ6_9ACTN|nr:hypothetical protein DN069_32295 [Streptacidiphilus pinicola]